MLSPVEIGLEPDQSHIERVLQHVGDGPPAKDQTTQRAAILKEPGS